MRNNGFNINNARKRSLPIMTLIPWRAKHRDEPTGLMPLGGFRTEMDRLFDSFFGDAFGQTDRPWGLTAWGPPLDVEETDKEIFVRAEIPGVKADELELSMHDNTLVICGEKKESEEKKEKGYYYQERRFGNFRREVPLPSAVDAEKIDAEYKDGVLHVTLRKSQEALPRRIPVKSK
jgi:HSP20 family protein